jgi:hypothetical protein
MLFRTTSLLCNSTACTVNSGCKYSRDEPLSQMPMTQCQILHLGADAFTTNTT